MGKTDIAVPVATEMQIAGFGFTKTGIVIDGKPTLAECQKAKEFIGNCLAASMWWWGGVLNYTEMTYGEAEEEGSYEHATLKDAKYVCANVAASVRTDALSFTHHKLVAQLPARKQVAWLKRAARDTLTVGQMRKAMRDEHAANSATPPLPDGEYNLILADPPWRYDFSKSDTRKIENQYPTMELEEICGL